MTRIAGKMSCVRCGKQFKKKTKWHDNCSRKCASETRALEFAKDVTNSEKQAQASESSAQ